MVLKVSVYRLLLVASGIAFLPSADAGQPPATLTIEIGKSTGKVSPILYGLMTEEINFSYDGGLYAELVRNRTLHPGWDEPQHWLLMPQGTARVTMEVDNTTSASSTRKGCLKLNVQAADANDAAAIGNEGYWGIPVLPATTYQASFYARTDAATPGPVTVSLVSNDTGKSLVSAASDPLTSDWKQYRLTLKTGAVKLSAANRLVLSVDRPGAVWFDVVSLFPPTYKNRPNGNRIDLMEKLAAMKPAFLRFPGGDYLEGDRIADRFDWKKTIGPIVDRPTHPSPWNYHSSDGMGLLEFLEWCEDLHMRPLLAVYAGYSLHPEHVEPGPGLEPYVQDALDEIEYVTGGTDTKWGAERAKDGHPEPFDLDYVEIGNEDEGDRWHSYDGRFAQFFDAIKKRYPRLQLIATTPVHSRKPDVVDDHYYKRADEFYAMLDHYDKVDRTGPKIFVGEWATRESSPTPDFNAALGDAAWMTSMERNSDLIVMASYAPLFTNVNPGGMQWAPDLIGYDALSSYGSPSYYAQVMFSNHIGTDITPAALAGGGPRLFYSVTSNPETGLVYLKIVNASSVPQAVKIELNGVAQVKGQAKLIALSAHSPADTNTLREPVRIVPVTSSLTGVKPRFDHVFAAYSINILELEAR